MYLPPQAAFSSTSLQLCRPVVPSLNWIAIAPSRSPEAKVAPASSPDDRSYLLLHRSRSCFHRLCRLHRTFQGPINDRALLSCQGRSCFPHLGQILWHLSMVPRCLYLPESLRTVVPSVIDRDLPGRLLSVAPATLSEAVVRLSQLVKGVTPSHRTTVSSRSCRDPEVEVASAI